MSYYVENTLADYKADQQMLSIFDSISTFIIIFITRHNDLQYATLCDQII